MKNRTVFAALALAVVLVALCGTLRLYRHAENGAPVAIGVAEASDAAERFCLCLEEGNLAELENGIYGYSDLNITDIPEAEGAQKLLECLRGSYRCTLSGEAKVDGMTAEQKVDVTYFSVYEAKDQLNAYVQEIFQQYFDSAQSYEELFDENDRLHSSVAGEIYDQALDRVIEDADAYMVTKRITLELIYADGRWQVVLGDSIVDILCGDINRV